MSRLHLKFLILAILVTVLGNMGTSHLQAEALFEEKLRQAKRLLSSHPTGWNFAMALESYGTYLDAVKIHPYSPSFLGDPHHADGGGIRRADDGSYEILLNPTVSVERMAHTLAHELLHIRDEIVADQLLEQNQTLRASIDETRQWIHRGDSHKALSKRPLETTYLMKALFCTEYRAHTLNLALQEEGLGDFFIQSKDSLLEHIRYGYIHRHGFKLTSSDETLLMEKCGYKRLQEHETPPIQLVLESVIPREKLRTSRDRS